MKKLNRVCLCAFQCHAVCHKNIPADCSFGVLQPIYLPPHAVSIPRTEVPMEAIIGVQVRRKETLSRKSGFQPTLVRIWSARAGNYYYIVVDFTNHV